jgi:pimeloyl-ACP methyl ester carboxylesterase
VQSRRLESSPERRVAGDGLTLAFREWNHEAPGEPLVLLHGIAGSSADWEATVQHLGQRRIIALDARGHGESDWDPDEAYSGDQHFSDVATALDALEVDRCTLVGFSMGGGVAIILAAALPERISGVVVVDTYPQPEMTAGSRRIASWVSRYAGGGTRFDPAIARHFRDQLEAGDAARLDLWPMWESIECPALIVRGESSDVLPHEVATEMLRRQPAARLVTVAGVAHGVPYARPQELAAAILSFLPAI